MKMTLHALILIFTLAALNSKAQAADNLSICVEKARWIITAEVAEAPKKAFEMDRYTTYSLHVKVLGIVKGKMANKEMYAIFNTSDLQSFAYLKKGSKCILFLKKPANDGSRYVHSVEPWTIFCIQPYSPEKLDAIGNAR